MSFDRVNRYCSKSKRNFATEASSDREQEKRRQLNQNWLDEFESPEQYVEAKLTMLRNEMYIEPSLDEVANLRELRTAIAIDNAVHSIIERHWG